MAVLGLQGVRGGVGTTTITAALAWSLQMLGENVLVVDACPDNLLRLSFNVDFTHRQGWASICSLFYGLFYVKLL